MSSAIRNKDASVYLDYPPLSVHLRPVLEISDEQVLELSTNNRDLRIERTSEGELIIMPPTAGETGDQNAEITMQLRLWAKKDGTGITYDSSTGFRLQNGAIRSPDAAWISKSRLASLTAKPKKVFINLSPDVVIELRSSTDHLNKLREKMEEYIKNGTRLGVLLNPEQREAFVYQENVAVKKLSNPKTVSFAPVLSGFVLDLREVW